MGASLKGAVALLPLGVLLGGILGVGVGLGLGGDGGSSLRAIQKLDMHMSQAELSQAISGHCSHFSHSGNQFGCLSKSQPGSFQPSHMHTLFGQPHPPVPACFCLPMPTCTHLCQ